MSFFLPPASKIKITSSQTFLHYGDYHMATPEEERQAGIDRAMSGDSTAEGAFDGLNVFRSDESKQARADGFRIGQTARAQARAAQEARSTGSSGDSDGYSGPGIFDGVSFRDIFSFNGRASCAQLWAVWVGGMVLFIIIGFVVANISPKLNDLNGAGGVVFTVLGGVYFWAVAATTVRRFHDLNYPGWIALTILIPLLGLIPIFFCFYVRGNAASNKYGSAP
jgi:uncharacterized membrane protein YhaH (DUF805 family)